MVEDIEDVADIVDGAVDEKEVQTLKDIKEHLQDEVLLRTHKAVDPIYVGHIESLNDGHCIVSYVTTEMMVADSERMVHSGFISMSAEYTALCAVNEPNGMMFHMDATYFAAARVGDEIMFEARVRHVEGRKREVDVVGKIDSIKIYACRATIVIPEYHPLKIKLHDVAGIKVH